MYPWLLGFFNGNTVTIRKYRAMEGKMFHELHPFIYKQKGQQNVVFNFIPSICKCDHGGGQKSEGNNSGGHLRCEKCAASFSPNTKKLLFSFAAMNETFQKNIPNLIHLAQVIFLFSQISNLL